MNNGFVDANYESAIVEGKKIIFFDNTIKCIIEGDFETNRITIVADLIDSKIKYISEIFFYEEKYVLVEKDGSIVHVYSDKDEIIEEISTNLPYKLNKSLIVNNEVFFIPAEVRSSIRKYNIEKNIVEDDEQLFENLLIYEGELIKFVSNTRTSLKFILPNIQVGVEVKLLEKKCVIYDVPVEKNALWWDFCVGTKCKIYASETKYAKCGISEKNGWSCVELDFLLARIIELNSGEFCVLPSDEAVVAIIDKKGKSIQKININNEDSLYATEQKRSNYVSIKEIGDTIYLIPYGRNRLVEINCSSHSVKEHMWESSMYIDKVKSALRQGMKYTLENEGFYLEALIDSLCYK